MIEQATRFPLYWPIGWKRTAARERERANFRRHVRGIDTRDGQVYNRAEIRPLTVSDAIKRLSGELIRLGATGEVLSTNVSVRLDGLPRSGQPEPSDPGAAVYFKLNGQDRCLACDKWDRVADNIAAIAQHIDALRRIDRYGVGTLEQAFAGYAQLPEKAASEWWSVLGVSPDSELDDVEAAFKELARTLHPDAGGLHEAMATLTAARAQARRALGAIA